MDRCPSPRRVYVPGLGVKEVGCRCRACPACGLLWLGDCKVMSIAAAEVMPAAVALITVTAPGKGRIHHCPRTGHVPPRHARKWNASATSRWRALWTVSSRPIRAYMEGQGERFRLLARAWEYQRRGLLHAHLIVPFSTTAEQMAAHWLASELHRRAREFDFGFVDRGKMTPNGDGTWSRQLESIPSGGAARYLCAYLTSSGAGKEGIAEVARKQGVPGPILYVAPELKRESGVSMRTLRNRRRVLATHGREASTREEWRVACTLDALSRGVSPLEPWTVETLRLALKTPPCASDGISRSSSLCDEHGVVIEPTDAPAPPAVARAPSDPCGLRAAWSAVRLDLVSHRVPLTEWIELRLTVEVVGRGVGPPPRAPDG